MLIKAFKAEIFGNLLPIQYLWLDFLGRMVEFEFIFSYTLCMAVQQQTLCILRISVLSCRLFMNPWFFANLTNSFVFDNLPEDTKDLFSA